MILTQAEINDVVWNLRKRAEIRRRAVGRKSTELGQVDRLADQLDNAADLISDLSRMYHAQRKELLRLK